MIKQKENSACVLVAYEELFEGLKIANRKGEKEITKTLYNLFAELDQPDIELDGKKYIGLKSTSKIVKYLAKELISIDSIKEAYAIASYEHNYEMKETLFKYLINMTENEIEGKDSTYLKEELKNDVKVYNYLNRHKSYSDFVKQKQAKKAKIKKLEK